MRSSSDGWVSMSDGAIAELRAAIDATGRYTVREEVLGGMNAYAFRALHRALAIDVFLKVFDTDARSPESELFREPRFLVEATAGGADNLVRVHDAERLGNDRVLVAMEFVEGGSLEAALTARALGQAEAVDLAVGILHGVAQLHSRDLVHRDLKPGNILVPYNAGRPSPKVGDFGSVARLPEADGAVTASRHTIRYVPPEGWEQPSRYTKRSDLYQVGLVLHEMAHGPFSDSDKDFLDHESPRDAKALGFESFDECDEVAKCRVLESAIARTARRRRLLDRAGRRPYVSPRLERIIRKATDPNPDRRFAHATDFIGALQQLAVPNWRPLGSCVSQALGWRGWDWRVEVVRRRKKELPPVLILRRVPGTSGTFRRWSTAMDLRAAFAEVEAFS